MSPQGSDSTSDCQSLILFLNIYIYVFKGSEAINVDLLRVPGKKKKMLGKADLGKPAD